MKKLDVSLFVSAVLLVLLFALFSSAQQSTRKPSPSTGKSKAGSQYARPVENDGFPMPSLIPGVWRTLDKHASQTLIDRLETTATATLRGVVTKIIRLRVKELLFYPGATLCEGVIPAAPTQPVTTLTFIALADGKLILLNGRAAPIHELNKAVPLTIDTREKVEEYVRFFGASVFGEEGSFLIVDNADAVRWHQGATANEKRKVASIIQPVRVTRPDINRWKITATVQYSNALFNTVFYAKSTGEVEMAEDTPIGADLPLKRQRFDGYLRREVTAKRAGNESQIAAAPSSAKTVAGGVMNGKAVSLPKPPYPKEARDQGIGGTVTVQVLIGTDGHIISAKAVSGDKLLRLPAENAARAARFSPTLLSGQPVKVSGVITYNFVAPEISASSLGISLRNAASAGDLLAVKMALSRGADVNAKNTDGFTALMNASSKGHLAVAQQLLLKGADVNAKSIKGYTSLSVAAVKGHLQVVKALLNKNADANAADSDGATALIMAAINGHLAVVETLIAKGARVNASGSATYLPLISASGSGHVSVVKALLDKNADVNARNKDGLNSLSMASFNGHLPVVRLLISKGARINDSTAGGTPLMLAAGEGHLSIVKELIANNANIFVADEDGLTARFHTDVGLARAEKDNTPKEKIDNIIAVRKYLFEVEFKPCYTGLGSEQTFSVNGRLRTEIDVKSGDRLMFNATGSVSFGMFAGSGGPDGIDGFQGYSSISTIKHGALIGRVKQPNGNDGWFSVGKIKSFVPNVAGTLELDINDRDQENNGGHFEVKVRVCKVR